MLSYYYSRLLAQNTMEWNGGLTSPTLCLASICSDESHLLVSPWVNRHDDLDGILQWSLDHHTASHVCLSLLTLCGLGESLLGLQSPRSLVLQPLVVLEKGHQGLGLLSHVKALVLVLLHKLEILQGLNCKYVLLALLGDLKI